MFDVVAQMTFHATFRIFPRDFAFNILSNNEFEMLDRLLDSFAPALKSMRCLLLTSMQWLLQSFASKVLNCRLSVDLLPSLESNEAKSKSRPSKISLICDSRGSGRVYRYRMTSNLCIFCTNTKIDVRQKPENGLKVLTSTFWRHCIEIWFCLQLLTSWLTKLACVSQP